jgi:RNA polymerase sigma-70 factor (ECF subfamily)
MTANVIANHRRKERLRRFFRRDLSCADRVASDVPLPSDELERRETARIVYRVLDRLSESDRQLLILHKLEGLSGEEIAELTGIDTKTLWVKLHRARKRFLIRLQADVALREIQPGAKRSIEMEPV